VQVCHEDLIKQPGDIPDKADTGTETSGCP